MTKGAILQAKLWTPNCWPCITVNIFQALYILQKFYHKDIQSKQKQVARSGSFCCESSLPVPCYLRMNAVAHPCPASISAACLLPLPCSLPLSPQPANIFSLVSTNSTDNPEGTNYNRLQTDLSSLRFLYKQLLLGGKLVPRILELSCQ
jgi:hypothetical protein